MEDVGKVDFFLSGVFSQSLQFTGEVSGNSINFRNVEDEIALSLLEQAFDYRGALFLFPTFRLSGTLTKSGNTVSGRLSFSAFDSVNNDASIFATECDFGLTPN